ncbi:MAG TPA: AI-2E family transporter [Syntrophorhabdaceae bacterium]|nr:AI-2E family transporter [Syntrophorhabdaceae bacterium]
MKRESKFYFLIMSFITVVLGYLSYKIIDPYLSPIMWAIVLSILFFPVYAFALKYVKRKAMAALITLAVILILLFGPISYLSYLVTKDVMSFVQHIESGSFDSLTTFFKYPATNSIVRKMLSLFQITEQEFQKGLIDSVSKMGQGFAGVLKTSVGNVVSGAVNFILMMLTTYFFLVDGPGLIGKTATFMPFSSKERDRLFRQTKDIVISTMYGGVSVAAAQGIVGGICFALLGIPSAVIWGLAMFVASFIPMIGTFIVWGPAAIYLFAQGHYIRGLIMIAVGLGIIGTVDNLVRPVIMRGRMKMPVIVIFFSILGGVQVFGFVGLIVGPLVFALFYSVFEIFRCSEEECTAKE